MQFITFFRNQLLAFTSFFQNFYLKHKDNVSKKERFSILYVIYKIYFILLLIAKKNLFWYIEFENVCQQLCFHVQ